MQRRRGSRGVREGVNAREEFVKYNNIRVTCL
jgi:hypothetical protein